MSSGKIPGSFVGSIFLMSGLSAICLDDARFLGVEVEGSRSASRTSNNYSRHIEYPIVVRTSSLPLKMVEILWHRMT